MIARITSQAQSLLSRKARVMTSKVKSQLLVSLSPFLLFPFSLPAQTCRPAPVGLVSWYPGDGNALDVRSRNNATLQTGATFGAGEAGQAFSLNGAGGFVSAPNDPTLNFGTGPFTIETWVKFNSTAGEQIILEKYVETLDASSTGYTLTKTGGNSILLALSGGAFFSTFSQPLFANTWYHIAATRDSGNVILIYLNGANIGASQPLFGQNVNSTCTLKLGHRGNPTDTPGSNDTRIFDLNGSIDEAAVYNRVLSQSEIQAIFNAGTAGKCKPTATVPPSGQVGWWPGDGSADDISGNANNGSLNNGAGFAPAEDGQGFTLGGNQFVSVNDSAVLNLTSQLGFEAWVYPASDDNGQVMAAIVNKELNGSSIQYEFARKMSRVCPNGGGIAQGNFALYLSGVSGLPNDCGGWVDGGAALPLNTWSHIAVTYDGSNIRSYVNGTLARTIAAGGSISVTTGQLRFGGRSANLEYWLGNIDEVSLYNRAITQSEITSIYNAGVAGKLKNNSTPTGANVTVNTTGDATVTFPNVTAAGTTQQIPLDASLFPPLPPGSFAGLAYDIATSASFTGNPTVCVNLPSFTPAQFANLRVVHFESGSWVMQTADSNAFPTLCSAPLPSLSPFAIVQVTPTVASVPVSGRVLTSDGRGLRNAIVTLTDRMGALRSVRSSSFGYYRFDDVPVGETYVIGVMSKRYQFAPQIVSVADQITGLNLVAEAEQ